MLSCFEIILEECLRRPPLQVTVCKAFSCLFSYLVFATAGRGSETGVTAPLHELPSTEPVPCAKRLPCMNSRPPHNSGRKGYCC